MDDHAAQIAVCVDGLVEIFPDIQSALSGLEHKGNDVKGVRDGFPGGRNGSASQQRLMAVNVIDITALAETVAEGTRLVVQ